MSILIATAEELGASGYDKFSIDRVARAAGVGKQTVYRWYPSKNVLIAECVLTGFVVTPTIPTVDSGDVRRDISDWVRSFAVYGSNAAEMARIRAITAASADDADIASKFEAHIISVTESALVRRLNIAIEAGQLKRTTEVRAVVQIILGALLFRVLNRENLDVDYADQIIGIVFDGIES